MFEFSINTVVGHRGCDELEYNNTVEAFLKGIELGADMIEFDVRRTKDRVLIINHDEDLYGNIIRDKEYEFLKISALKKGLQIPTLNEALTALKGKAKPYKKHKERKSGCNCGFASRI
jgi:glycerophosphoryl diester phosphodiesterase